MADMKLTPQQRAVVEDRGGTLLVSAAAGSGKTKVLVDRVMTMLQREGKNINEFLIITFTNAAAAELRGKISAAISKALARDPGDRHLRRQLSLLPLSQISTVHAFCGSLIRQYGFLQSIPADCRMLEDGEREELLDRLLGDLLEEKYGEKDPDFLLLADTLGAGRSDSGLEDLVKALFEKLLSQPYPERWLEELTLSVPPETELTETVWGVILVENAKKQLSWLLERYDRAISMMEGEDKLEKTYLPLFRTERSTFSKMLEKLEGPWDAIGPALQMDFARLPAVRDYPDTDRKEAIQQTRKDAKSLLGTLRSQLSRPAGDLIREQNQTAPALKALAALTGELYRRFSREKRRKNVMDFSDQEHLAISLLVGEDGAPTDLAREVSARFSEIMVDEYQDSNRVQELIFTAISKGKDESRFLVGDVKQSIYGFRQAEPEIFLRKYQTYAPAETAETGEARKLILSKNFRSRPEILEAVNHTFSSLMSPEVGGLTYGAEESLYPGLEEYPSDGAFHVSLDVLSLKKLPQGRDDDSTKYQREAAWVAGRIVRLLEDQVPVRGENGVRPVEPGDVAILLRSRDPMGTYQKALERAGVPVSAGGKSELFETPEVQGLMDLLRTLDNPRQDVPLLSVLCGPLFRFSNDQLAKIRSGSQKQRFYDAMTECPEDWCQKALKELSRLREKAQTTSAEVLVGFLLGDTGLLAAYSAMEGGKARAEHLTRVYTLSQEIAGGDYLYLYELLQALDRRAAAGTETAGPKGGVTLTTIHKSKGLEYPVVFLSDLSRKFNFRELSDLLLVDGDQGVAARITDTARRVRYPGLCYQALRIEKRKKLLSEELRVLYVAMTRPKDYLFMTYAMGESDGTLKKLLPGAGSPAAAWAAAGAGCLGDWVLLAALSRAEAGELFRVAGRPQCDLTVSDYPWHIGFTEIETPQIPRYVAKADDGAGETEGLPSPEQVVRAMTWRYPHEKAVTASSKLTATQLKGRDKDSEISENAAAPVRLTPLPPPEFLVREKPLSPTERGTAAHLFLQYARFPGLNTEDGVISELDRLVEEEYITEPQGSAVEVPQIVRLFSSPLGQRLLTAENLIREFKFSLLTDAAEYDTDLAGEKILLQGVVDAAIVEEGGLTVVDFKTDRVFGDAILRRAEHYRPQLAAYEKALERIFKKPVKEKILYFLQPGKEVRL